MLGGPPPALSASATWLGPELALAGIGPGGRVISVVEGAEEVLSFAAAGAEVVAVTARPDQAALLALLQAAVRELPPQSRASMLGYGHFGRRVWFYHHLRARLPDFARSWWDAHEAVVRLGIWRGGEREQAVARARRILAFAPGRPLWAGRVPWRRAVVAGWAEHPPRFWSLLDGPAPSCPWPWITAAPGGSIRVVSTVEEAGDGFDLAHLGEDREGLGEGLARRARRLRRWGAIGTRDPGAPFSGRVWSQPQPR